MHIGWSHSLSEWSMLRLAHGDAMWSTHETKWDIVSNKRQEVNMMEQTFLGMLHTVMNSVSEDLNMYDEKYFVPPPI